MYRHVIEKALGGFPDAVRGGNAVISPLVDVLGPRALMQSTRRSL
jgi:hypothetical protein